MSEMDLIWTDEEMKERISETIEDVIHWICEKYEVFEPVEDGYTLYQDMNYHFEEELKTEYLNQRK